MTGWLVCWTEKELDTPTKQTQHIDHYVPFIDFIDGFSPKEQATTCYQALLQREEIFSANLCHIKDSTEPHYLDVEEPDESRILSENKNFKRLVKQIQKKKK